MPKSQKHKNILIIGRTGSGKSALANVITNTNNFKESEFGVSETQNIQVEEFELAGEKYKVFDTVGIGNTQLSEKEVLQKIIEKVYSSQEEINQVFFTVSGKFTKEEIEVLKLLKKIFESNAAQKVVVVRTKFADFEDAEKCETDQRILFKENEVIFDLINSCKVIYVDNPPLVGWMAEVSKKIREISRNRLLNHLTEGGFGKVCDDRRKLKEQKYQKEKELEKIKDNCLRKVRVNIEEELNNLCQLQKEITKLEIKLEEIAKKEEKQHFAKIISDIGSIDVSRDNVRNLIDNTFGDYFANNWTNIHPDFTPELIQSWQNLNFTYEQTRDWINVGIVPQDYNFAHFLKIQKNLTPEQTLSYHNLENLNQEFFSWWQNQQTAQIQQNNFPNFNN